ncbi:RagB/SusD family nutrient uptake outer membrane protein [Butyricimonas hominis]|uniref:RagB/SusD family nutrient uptake outer membrane protein n=1 Tax=Butyricimonas TaxID=574697 RepID=UPI003511404F
MKLHYYIYLALILCGCNDFLEYKDKDKLIPKELDHYNELIYGELIKKADGGELQYLDVMSDETDSYVKPLGTLTRVDDRKNLFKYYTWAQQTQVTVEGSDNNDNNWAYFYHKILMCNIIEHDVNQFENDIEGVKNRLLGEVCFLRAMSYYFLVNLYGEPYRDKEQAKTAAGVPINDAISVEIKKYTRATLAEIYTLIETDLNNSITYLEKGEQLNSTFRPNVHVARLFLSRIYLYTQEWQKAAEAANDVITYSGAKIETLEHLQGYKEKQPLYNENNPSILFSWSEKNSPIHDSNNEGIWRPSEKLLALYNTSKEVDANNHIIKRDYRDTAFFYKIEKNDYLKPMKYDNLSRTCYDRAYRIEEAYLNRAEAYIQLGGKDNIEKAIHDINAIRKERINTDYEINASTETEAMQYLQNEKLMELCFEEVRWFDIRRWKLEINHIYQDITNPPSIKTYTLKADSPNYIMPIPLKVQEVNNLIKLFEREEILPN